LSRPRGSLNNWRGVKIECPLGKARDAGEDLVSGLGPHEGRRLRMVRGNEFSNRGLQLRHAAMHTATALFVGELSEPPLHEVQPRPVRRREVDVKTRALGEPIPNQGVLCVP